MSPVDFVKEAIEELKKVTWPTKDELVSHTTVVIISVIFCAVLIWVVDTFFSTIFRFILQ